MKKKKSIDLYEQKAISSKGIVLKYFKMLFKIKFPWHLYALTLLTSYLYTKAYLLVPKKQMAIAGGDFSSNAIKLVVLALIFKSLSRCLDDLTSTFFEKTTTRNAQKNLWKRILKFNASKFDDMQPRELITRLTTDTSNVRMLPNLVKNVLMSCMASFAIIKFLGTYDRRLVYAIICIIPLMVLVQIIETMVMFKLEAKTTYKLAVAARYIADSLTNMPIYKIFNKEDKATKAGEKYINDMFKINVTKGVSKKSFYYAQELVIVIAKVITVVYGSILMFKGDITFAVWYAFYMYSQQFIRAITGVFGSIIGIRTSAGSVARVIRLFDEELEDESGENKFNIKDISFKNVCFSYNEGDEVLHNISFKIEKGKKIAIVGLSGSGKSTLISLITRLYNPSKGLITNSDENIKSYAINTWRSKIGVVSQDTMLYSGTVFENLTYGLDREVSDEEIKQVVQRVNLNETFEKLSEGYDTNIGELGSFFSGGEKQRLAVARVLLRKPEVIILDEACSALDMENDKLINELIVRECENVTIINVTHRLSNIENYEEIIIIDEGKIKGIGTHKYLLENNKNYQNMYNVEINKKINI